MSTKKKPTVLFRGNPALPLVVGMSAIIRPVNHPSELVSNTKDVITSPVVRIYSNESFETQNTHYRKLYEEVVDYDWITAG